MYDAEYVREKRRTRIEAGICTICGYRPARPGMKTCFKCALHLSKLATKRRENRARNDEVCSHCGRPLIDKRYRTCESCRAYMRDYFREYRRRGNG